MHNLVTPSAALEDAYANLLTDIKEAILDEIRQFKEEEQQAMRSGNYHAVDFSKQGLLEDILINIKQKIRKSDLLQQATSPSYRR